MSLRITVLIPGPPGRIDACRRSINAMLDDDRSIRYREKHSAARLEYGLTSRAGVPFPPFVEASTEYPELTFAFSWEGLDGEAGGRATIESGRLVSQAVGVQSGKANDRRNAAVHVVAAHDGTIHLAVACSQKSDDECIGYVVTAAQHAYFSWQRAGDESCLMTTNGIADAWESRWTHRNDEWTASPLVDDRMIPAATLTTLEQVANDFAAEWLWFAAEEEVDTALERHRFVLYGLVVYPANLRSEKVRTLPRDAKSGITYSTVQAEQTLLIDALDRCWRASSR
jgi:hypothetical protein